LEEDATLGRIGGFRLIKRLATGGTSDVLLARAEGPHGFERTVVLKRLLTEHQSDPDFARMFAREAAAYARLSHPAIVRLFDFFTANGQLVMVLEYVDGVSLAKLMTHAAQNNIKLDDRVCFFIAARIYDALSAAHDARNPDTGDPTPVIHRDVNPSNVLIPWDGHAKLADFGIAKIEGIDAETQQGLIKGTYGYMAPEQVRGERVTIRTDVYAATLVLWELLARRKAIQSDRLPEMEILRAMAEPNLPKMDVLRPELHESVREAITRGLEPNPAKRSITAEEMMGLLRAHFDAEDARTRLMQALEPLGDAMGARGKLRSFSDTTAVSTRNVPPPAAFPTGETAVASYNEPAINPAITLPLPTRDALPRPGPPRPTPSTAAPAPQWQAATAVKVEQEPIKRQTPSGFRAVGQPQPLEQPQTLAGGFHPSAPPPAITVPNPMGSEPPTLQTAPPPPAALQHVMQHPQPQLFQPPPVMPLPVPPRRSSFLVPILLAALSGVMVVAIGGAVVVFLRQREATTTEPAVTAMATATVTATATATATATVTATVATATATATTAESATATVASATASATVTEGLPTPGPTEGVLILPAYAKDHRIFVDGKVKGDGNAPLVLSCGQHTIQIGSAGKSRDMNIPCGALARIE
jgi:serine/threonine protein kinase